MFCCSKAAAVKEYLEASKWNVVPDEDSEPEDVFAAAQVDSRTGVSTGPDIRILTGSAVTSAGDALREIDSMGVIRSKQFILVSGDVISNMNLAVRSVADGPSGAYTAAGDPIVPAPYNPALARTPRPPAPPAFTHVHRLCWSSTRLGARLTRRR